MQAGSPLTLSQHGFPLKLSEADLPPWTNQNAHPRFNGRADPRVPLHACVRLSVRVSQPCDENQGRETGIDVYEAAPKVLDLIFARGEKQIE
jgi:hypothetical protein